MCLYVLHYFLFVILTIFSNPSLLGCPQNPKPSFSPTCALSAVSIPAHALRPFPCHPCPLRGLRPPPWRSPRAPPRPPAPCASARPASRCWPTAATAFAGRAWCASGRRKTGPSRVPSAPTTAGSAPWSPAARRSAAACWRSRRRPRRPHAMARLQRLRCSCCAAPTEGRCVPPAAWPRGPNRRSGSPAGGRRCAARCARAAPLCAAFPFPTRVPVPCRYPEPPNPAACLPHPLPDGTLYLFLILRATPGSHSPYPLDCAQSLIPRRRLWPSPSS